jgi:hypothetical protein
MDLSPRSPQGQVNQDNSAPLSADTNPTLEVTGPALKMTIVEGKKGSVTKIGMVQTDYSDSHSGPAPSYEGPGNIEDGKTN